MPVVKNPDETVHPTPSLNPNKMQRKMIQFDAVTQIRRRSAGETKGGISRSVANQKCRRSSRVVYGRAVGLLGAFVRPTAMGNPTIPGRTEEVAEGR